MIVWTVLAIVLFDQISKLAVTRFLGVHESVTVINGFFNLVHIRNRGMAFGIMNRPDIGLGFYFMLAAGLGAVILLGYWFAKLKEEDFKVIFGFSLILGGAVGNLIDRVRIREVIDFLDFYVGTYHWPSFNMADSAITVGAFLVALSLLFKPKPTT